MKRSPEDAMRAVLAFRERPDPPGAIANALTFAWRALLKIKHLPEQLFDVIMTPIMFTVLFTFIFGGAIHESPERYLQEILLPGILVQTVVFTSIYTGFTLNTDISRGIFDRFRSMPIWTPSPIIGAMLGDTMRYTASSSIVFLVGLLLGYRPEAGIFGVVQAILFLDLAAFGMSWFFIVAALLVRTPGTVMTLSWLVLMPLTFASNIFVPVETMPSWLQSFIAVNPVALLVTAMRGILSGTASAHDLLVALIAPAIVFVLLAPTAMALYRRRR